MPTFTIRDLFLMTTLVAVGVAGLVFMDQQQAEAGDPLIHSLGPFLWFVIFFAFEAMIGAGLFVPLKRVKLGAFVGIIGCTILVLAIDAVRYRATHPGANITIGPPIPTPAGW